jgi:hypothetical protein
MYDQALEPKGHSMAGRGKMGEANTEMDLLLDS